MMKKICALIVLAVIVASCKDDPKPSVEQLMTAATDGWVFNSVIAFDPSTGAQVDLVRDPDVFEPCNLDDALIFASDGTFTVLNNNKCDPADPDIGDDGTWTLNDNKSELVILSSSGVTLVELSALEVTETRIKGETSKLGALPVLAIVTFRKYGTF